jgi:hypothetical protein
MDAGVGRKQRMREGGREGGRVRVCCAPSCSRTHVHCCAWRGAGRRNVPRVPCRVPLPCAGCCTDCLRCGVVLPPWVCGVYAMQRWRGVHQREPGSRCVPSWHDRDAGWSHQLHRVCGRQPLSQSRLRGRIVLAWRVQRRWGGCVHKLPTRPRLSVNVFASRSLCRWPVRARRPDIMHELCGRFRVSIHHVELRGRVRKWHVFAGIVGRVHRLPGGLRVPRHHDQRDQGGVHRGCNVLLWRRSSVFVVRQWLRVWRG